MIQTSKQNQGHCLSVRFLLSLSVLSILTFLTVYSRPAMEETADKWKFSPLLLNNRPIIGILSQEISHTLLPPRIKGVSYIAASYVKYLESAGARVVPILINHHTVAELKLLFNSINGVLFPGGGAAFFTSGYYKNAVAFYKMALDANDKGDYFPIWGTCLGFETLHTITANSDVGSPSDAEDLPLPLNFTDALSYSRMFKIAPRTLIKSLEVNDITYNHHTNCVTPDAYKKYPALKEFYRILSVNNDRKGKTFVSTVEAYKYPIYGTQWHPEKNAFEWTTKLKLPHTEDAVRAAQYVADFFVNEARRSRHRFNTTELETKYLIYNYTPVFTGDAGHFEQCYVF